MEHTVLSPVRRGLALGSGQVRWPQKSRCCLSLVSAATGTLDVILYRSTLQHTHTGFGLERTGFHIHNKYPKALETNIRMVETWRVCFSPCYAARLRSQTKNVDVLLGQTLEKIIIAPFCSWEGWSYETSTWDCDSGCRWWYLEQIVLFFMPWEQQVMAVTLPEVHPSSASVLKRTASERQICKFPSWE